MTRAAAQSAKTAAVPANRNTEKANRARRDRGNYKARSATGVVTADESFTSDAFIERLGITRTQLNEMRRRGLVARRDGGRVRILGSDYLAYLQQCPAADLNEVARS